MHVDNGDNIVVQNDTPTGGPASSSNIDPFPTPVNVQTDFAKFSSRSRVLGRMTSEQALKYFLDQHNKKCSESIEEHETCNHSQNAKENKKELNAANENAKHRRLSETDGDTEFQLIQFRQSLKRKAE